MKLLHNLYKKLPRKTRKFIEKLFSPYVVIVHDVDLKRKVVHYARTLKGARDWGQCYGVMDRVNVYHDCIFCGRRRVATEVDC